LLCADLLLLGIKSSFLNKLNSLFMHTSPGLDEPRVGASFQILPSEFGKLPATRGASNPWLIEPASMFGFYPIHIVALCDIFVDVFSSFSWPKKITALLILLYLRLDYLYCIFLFGYSSSPKTVLNSNLGLWAKSYPPLLLTRTAT
jgi:hypothetical protein